MRALSRSTHVDSHTQVRQTTDLVSLQCGYNRLRCCRGTPIVAAGRQRCATPHAEGAHAQNMIRAYTHEARSARAVAGRMSVPTNTDPTFVKCKVLSNVR